MEDDTFHKQNTQPGLNIPFEGFEKNVLDHPPSYIGPYKIESLLERGGMSLLYLGTHPETKDPVILKILSPKFVLNPEIVERFLKETSIIALLDHPNIVKMHGHGEWEGGLYIAMEFIQGISLRQHILQTPVSLKKAIEFILEIAYALCHLHTHGIIHRDLKPENVIIADSGEVKVIDFGIAQILSEKKEEPDEFKQRTIGTPIYMSPEQKENPEDVSYPTDIYSLGIIAYELILGKLSHGHIHIALMPKGLQKIFNKMLQTRPEERYHDVVDLISDLSAYMDSPAIEKEKKAGDQLSEFSENMRSAQGLLLPSSPPLWEGFDTAIAGSKGTELTGIYYDFLEVREGVYGVILGESSAKGTEGVVYAAVLRGMIRAISQQTKNTQTFISSLNTLLSKDSMDQVFTLSYIEIAVESDRFSFITSGFGCVWHLPGNGDPPTKLSSGHIALGVDPTNEFAPIEHLWGKGDAILLTSSIQVNDSNESLLSDARLKEVLIDLQPLCIFKKMDGILRKIKAVSNQGLTQALFLIGIEKKN